MTAGRAAHFQAVLDDYQARRRLPSLVAGVLGDGAPVWTGAAGTPATVDTQYRIGSITKTLTAVLVLQCRDDGLLDLEDPIGRIVPETGYREARVRALLAHASGMQSEPVGPWWERSPGVGFDELVGANDGSGAVFGPGETFHYSNLGFALLGEAVARLRGQPWESLVTSRVLQPLGMGRTTYHPVAPAAPGLSVHHLAGTLSDEPSQDSGAMAPAGQLWSTVSDLALFAQFLRAGGQGVLSAESMREMQAPDPASDGDYGLGVNVLQHGEASFVGHLGSMPGFQSCLYVEPGTGEGVVALTNGTTGFMGGELTERLLGHETPGPVEPWVPSSGVPAWAAELIGFWYWGNSAFELRWHNDLLEFRDLARGILAERFDRRDGRIVGVAGYHHGETLHVHASHLECATFVYTRTPYDPRAPIPGAATR